MSSLQNIYARCLITSKEEIRFTDIGKNIEQTLTRKIAERIEGVCIAEGYIQPKSVKINTFSSGVVQGNMVIYNVVFECNVFMPYINMELECVALSNTTAGIMATNGEDTHKSPFVFFVARDFEYNDPNMSLIQKGTKFIGTVTTSKCELNDTEISIIGVIKQIK